MTLEENEKYVSEVIANELARLRRDLRDAQSAREGAERERDAAMGVVNAVQAFLNKYGAQRFTHWGLAEALAEFGQAEQAARAGRVGEKERSS